MSLCPKSEWSLFAGDALVKGDDWPKSCRSSLWCDGCQMRAGAGMSSRWPHHYFGGKESDFVWQPMRYSCRNYSAEVRREHPADQIPSRARPKPIIRASFEESYFDFAASPSAPG